MERSAAVFVGDHPAMDFLNSIENPALPDSDWLTDGLGLLAWLVRAGLVDQSVATTFADDPTLDGVAAEATALREWFRAVVSLNREIGKLDALNDILAEDDGFDFVVAGEAGPILRHRQLWSSPRQLLQPIARAIADVLVNEDMTLIRVCGGPTCTLAFVDRTKSHGRRWCSMAVCGNRAKSATHRHRHRGQQTA